MKDILIEIKNNLQGNNSRVDGAKNQIHDWNTWKQKTTSQNKTEEKRIQETEYSVGSSGTTSSVPSFAS